MKKGLILLTVLNMSVMLILSACAEPVVEETPVEAPPAEEEVLPEEPYADIDEVEEIETPVAEGEDDDFDDEDARMEALISEKIQNCHMLNFILSQTKTAEEWDITITRMIGKGAQINDEEKEMIINWLVSRNE